MLKHELKLHDYTKTMEPLLIDTHRYKPKKFANWISDNFWKQDTMRICFFDEEMFDIDGIYNYQNEQMWTTTRREAHEKLG